MIAALLGEPFCKDHDAIARLTDRQIVDHYFHPRDELGRLDFGGSSFDADDFSSAADARDRLREMARQTGVSIQGGGDV